MLLGEEPLAGARVISAVGSGGKTSLLAALARELPGQVVLCTTTHIRPLPGMPLVRGGVGDVAGALARSRLVCVGTPTEDGKAKIGVPACGIGELAALADHVLVEADGSRQLPLKAHAAWEPVVPPESDACVLVVGASGLGRPVKQVVHRPELFCKRAGCATQDLATPERVAQVVATEVAEGLLAFDHLLVNQVADSASRQAAMALVGALAEQGVSVPYGLDNLPRV